MSNYLLNINSLERPPLMQVTFGARSRRQSSPNLELGQRGRNAPLRTPSPSGNSSRQQRTSRNSTKDFLHRTLGDNRVIKTISSSSKKAVTAVKWIGKNPITSITTALAIAGPATFTGMAGHRLTTCKFDKVPEGAIAVIQGGKNTATAPCPIWMTKKPNGNARVSGGYDGFWKGIGDNG